MMGDSDNAQLGISVSEFIESLFDHELSKQEYDQDIVHLVRRHLGPGRPHSKAGDRLAEALEDLAQRRAEEETK
jgi:hypothetical protein